MPEHRLALLGVGEELLAGDVVDTNSPWIARRARQSGWRVVDVAIVGDDRARIRAAIERAATLADAVVVTGGLGPTHDDLTRFGVADAFGLGIERREELVEHLHAVMAGFGRAVKDTNLQQCDVPAGATVLPNPNGTAAGFLVRGALANGTRDDLPVACLPGVPREMRPMAEAVLDGPLATGTRREARTLRLFGPTESSLAEQIAPILERAPARGVEVGITASGGVLSVTGRGTDRAAVDAVVEQVRATMGPTVFGEGDETLAVVVVGLLRARGATVTTAESCTGGLLAGAITSVAGSSDCFEVADVTYADTAKRERLGVPAALIEAHGAVSEDVVRAMAEGQRARTGADWALSVSGVAGPGGGSPDKPVGTVWLGLCGPGGTEARRYRWRGPRDVVRARSVLGALDMLRRRLIADA